MDQHVNELCNLNSTVTYTAALDKNEFQNSKVDGDRPLDNISMDSDSYVTIEERTLEDELDDDTTTNEQEDDLKTCLYCGKNEANLKDMFLHMHVTHGIHMKNIRTYPGGCLAV